MAGTEVAAPPAVRLPRAASVLVGAVVVCGSLAVLVHLRDVAAWTPRDLAACLGLLLATALAEQFVLPLFHGEEGEAFSITDALWVPAVVFARPSVVIAAVAGGALVGQLLAHRAPHKVAFNVGQYALAISAALLVHEALGGTDPLAPETWGAIVAAMTAYFVVNETLVAAVIALAGGGRFGTLVTESLGLSVIHWATNVAVGLLAAVVWAAEPLALPLLLVPLGVSHHAYRGWLRTLSERDQMNEMARTADVIAEEGDLTQRIAEVESTARVAALARTLNRMLNRLEAGFERERRFFNEASHELRTPVTICRGHLEVMGADPDPDEVRETVGVLLDELELMGRILDDMSTLANADSSRFIQVTEVPAELFVGDVSAKMAPLLNGRLETVDVSPGAVVRADPQRLAQALVNLLTNAALHGAGEGPVHLALVEEGSHWRFDVSDTGGGLAAGDDEHVFEPFWRGRTSAPGSGLGLPIVRRVAEAHGGTAGVENRPGVGARFWLTIPR
jgi:signal transduction histidine kinase